MKKMIVLFLVLPFLFSCSSSKHYIKKGRFDDAVKKSVKLLRKNPEKEKEIANLAEAFRQANQQNQDKILLYKKSGQPDIWDEVYDQYVALRDRENLVKTVSRRVLDQIGFQYVDYDSDIQAAEKKACEYYYAHAGQLLEKNDKYAARQAYGELTRIKRHFSNYKDVDNLRSEAYNKGMTRVFFKMVNDSRMVIPEEFEQDILQMKASDLNRQWTLFYTSDPGDVTFDYDIIFFLKTVMVGPSKVRESEHEEKREIEDGWVYLYDKNGNVRKDSLGKRHQSPPIRADFL
ncbi:MAG: hypothetical protein FJY10_00725 [Bacteroidetes bacterium]|nr:hypothetical protein [Bacteroidota bacterium]